MKSLLRSFCLVLCLLVFVSCSADEESVGKDGLTFEERKALEEPKTVEEKEEVEIAVDEDLEYPFYLTTMTHLEESFTDDVDEGMFNIHTESIRSAIDLADQYGAKLTFESERPFAQACINWGVNVLQEILDAGHGVGTHCDRGFNKNSYDTYEEFIDALSVNKKLVDDLIGEENNLGCSGAGSSYDWGSAMIEADFSYVNGVVAMHYLSMPLDIRPDGYTDDYIKSVVFHSQAPIDLYDRIYPRLLADGLDFKHDEDGELVLLSGSVGKLQSQDLNDNNDKAPTTSDVDVLIDLLREIDENRDRSQIAKIDMYFSINDLNKKNYEVLEYFFQEMEKLVEEGIVVWATQAEVYHAYMDTL